jgi:ankyrin repeat protein
MAQANSRVLLLLGMLVVLAPLQGCSGDDLVAAATKGDLDRMRQLIERGADVDKPMRYGFRRENEGDTPLTAAVQHGPKEAVELLIASGANVNLGTAGDQESTTPLDWAAVHDRADVAGILIAAGADVNARTSTGWSALLYALNGGNLEFAELLTSQGAVPEFKDYTAILSLLAPPELLESVEFLVGHGLEVNARSPSGDHSLLSYAEAESTPEVGDLLRSLGARE